jgi:amino acid adenylation domain-containing protein/non-ribosomal peptide synthase protein (TIGR01720 family)
MNRKVVHEVFDQAAFTYPENVAVREPDNSISYQGLQVYANRIAHALEVQRSAPGMPVALYMNSGIAYIAGVLGISKAGGIFAPLDVTYPSSRLVYILTEVMPAVILTTPAHLEALTTLLAETTITAQRILVLHDNGNELAAVDWNPENSRQGPWETYPAKAPALELTGEESLYLLYTSGSTGTPKAIEGCHKSLSHFIHWELSEFALDHTVVVAQLAPVLFDVSLRDFFLPLLCGGTVCIPARHIKEQPELLVSWISDMNITLLHMVPSVFRLMTKALMDRAVPLPHLRYILLAGEPLYGKDVLRWQETAHAAVQLVNLYGPSETTLAKIFNRITGPVLEPAAIMPLGKPISNTIIIIIKNNKLCEIGEIGEIYIKTPFRSRGYFRNEALTRMSFVQNPLHNESEDIVYKTGDLARYDKDRNVIYVGRQDTQVKIRGNRVEIAEIEKCILELGAVGQTVILPVVNADGENILACYYILAGKVNTKELQEHLQQRLPAYMHPSFYIPLPEFPLGLNGKVDKKALPRPEEILYEHLQYIAPDTALETQLTDVWKETLGLRKVGVTNSFFELGGHSLNAMKVITRIYKYMGKEIMLKDFFDHPTIRQLAQLLESRAHTTFKPILPVPRKRYYDVSHAQQRMWLINQIEEEQAVYNIPGAYIFSGAMDRAAFENAFRALIARHESLRTTFLMVEGTLKQRITSVEDFNFNYQYTDLRDTLRKEEKAADMLAAEAIALFDLEQGPLFRTTLLHMEEEKFIFFFTIHHIVSDGWSRGVLIDEITSLYNAFSNGQSNPLPPLSVQYKDYAAWQNELLQDDTSIQSHRAYWLQRFTQPLPVLDCPADYPRPKVKTYAGKTLGFSLGRTFSRELLVYGQQQEVSPFMLLLTAVKVLLSRYTGQTDLIIGTPIAGRDHHDLEGQIGFYVNTLAIRSQFSFEQTFREVLAVVKEHTLNAQHHQLYPFDKLVDDLNLGRDMSRSPLFDVMVVLQNAGSGSGGEGMDKVATARYGATSGFSKYDLTFHFNQADDEIFLGIEYNTALFKEERMQRMFLHYKTLLQAVLDHPGTDIGSLNYLPAAEKAALIAAGEGRPFVSFTGEETLVQRFEAQVRRTPDAIAVEDAQQRLTYAELNTLANQLAHYLRRQYHIQPEQKVALLMERSVATVAGIFGILKSGAAYVPVDPDYPAERIAYTLEDAAVAAVVTDISNTLSDDRIGIAVTADQQLQLKDKGEMIVHTDSSNPLPVLNAGSLAYIIYTSGSTGQPKGVMVAHQQVMNLLFAEGFRFDFGPADIWTLFHSVCFDFSVWEIFGSLLYGGQLIIVEKALARNATSFAELICRKGVTVLNQVPGMFTHVMDALLQQQEPHQLRYIIFGGEALHPASLAPWNARYPQVQLINMYGITETTVHVTYKAIGETEIAHGLSNIGVPLPNVRLYIMDARHQLLPFGVEGEIVVGGGGVSAGYLNRATLTAERFIADPYHTGERLYCSGDTGVMLPGGEVIYHGRKDDQVKIRGYRIELGEITQQLLQYEGIEHAIVTGHPDPGGQQQLVAYFVSRAPQTIEALRAHLQARLPDYMLPAYYVQVPLLPVTANGKIDVKQLPSPEDNSIATGTDYVAPETPMEILLTTVFEKVLGRTKISVLDNFFMVGGDSIKAIQIAAGLYKEGYRITVKDIFMYPVIRELAPVAHKTDRIADQSLVSGLIPLTPIQHDFFSTNRPSPHHFNQAVMLYAAEGFELPLLEKAFHQLQEHHDVLRAVFYQDHNGMIVQENKAEVAPLSLEIFDLREAQDVAARMQEYANEIQGSINLATGPLLKLGLFRLQDGERLLIVLHHLVVDGVSWRIIFEDLESLYQQYKKGPEATLPLKTDAYKEWATRLKAYANSPALLSEIKYWHSLEAAAPEPLRKDFPASGNRLDQLVTHSISLSEADTELLLTKVNTAFNTEINDILMAALSLAVKHSFGPEKIMIAMEGHGREEILADIDISRTIGWFTTIYPVVLDTANEALLSLHIKEIKESLRKTPHKGIGYGLLKYLTDEVHKKELIFNMQPQISFNYLGQFDTDFKDTFFQVAAGPKGNIQDLANPRAYELDISGMITGGRLTMNAGYNYTHFREDTIVAFLQSYQEQLTRIIAYCAGMSGTDLSPSDLGYKGLTIDDLETFFD